MGEVISTFEEKKRRGGGMNGRTFSPNHRKGGKSQHQSGNNHNIANLRKAKRIKFRNPQFYLLTTYQRCLSPSGRKQHIIITAIVLKQCSRKNSFTDMNRLHDYTEGVVAHDFGVENAGYVVNANCCSEYVPWVNATRSPPLTLNAYKACLSYLH